MFSFGDSFADTGNNPAVFAWFSVFDPVTRPPYGFTFFGHPTGRNSDGRLILDFIVTPFTVLSTRTSRIARCKGS
ncbi:hypothetical protein BAE44_0017267 [Dichanthelium oligosanthes]|uniref:GDSL esterase/lipase n=1 Tax=Dichanthelium oligosanthes TaxID=888268 RepID=A0A1E5V987_9POAL|nr:hypothetical protein BAE44_0017267 [Dichanthelium oligosanthes]